MRHLVHVFFNSFCESKGLKHQVTNNGILRILSLEKDDKHTVFNFSVPNSESAELKIALAMLLIMDFFDGSFKDDIDSFINSRFNLSLDMSMLWCEGNGKITSFKASFEPTTVLHGAYTSKFCKIYDKENLKEVLKRYIEMFDLFLKVF